MHVLTRQDTCTYMSTTWCMYAFTCMCMYVCTCAPAWGRRDWQGTRSQSTRTTWERLLTLPTALPSHWCCSVLQCVAVCCSVRQCDSVCCSLRQCVAVFYSVLQCAAVCYGAWQCVAVWCSVLPCGAVCGSVLQCVAVCYIVRQCVAVCCSVLQCVAVWFSVLQYAADSVLQYVTRCGSMWQCVTVCDSVLQCAAVCCSGSVATPQSAVYLVCIPCKTLLYTLQHSPLHLSCLCVYACMLGCILSVEESVAGYTLVVCAKHDKCTEEWNIQPIMPNIQPNMHAYTHKHIYTYVNSCRPKIHYNMHTYTYVQIYTWTSCMAQIHYSMHTYTYTHTYIDIHETRVCQRYNTTRIHTHR